MKRIEVTKENAVRLLREKVERCCRKKLITTFLEEWDAEVFKGQRELKHSCPMCCAHHCNECPAEHSGSCVVAINVIRRMRTYGPIQPSITLAEARKEIREALRSLEEFITAENDTKA